MLPLLLFKESLGLPLRLIIEFSILYLKPLPTSFPQLPFTVIISSLVIIFSFIVYNSLSVKKFVPLEVFTTTFPNNSSKSLLLSKKRFKYIFTAIRGENLNKQKIIFRDNVIPEDGICELYTYLSGYLDFIYSKEKKIIEKTYHKIF